MKKILKSVTLVTIITSAVILVGCNSGGSANQADTTQLSQLSSKSMKSDILKNKLADANVTNGNVMHLYQSDLYKNTKRNDYGVKQSILPSTIGWDSVNNRPAQMNCWTYTEQATNSGTSGNVGGAYNAHAAENSLNINGSVSTQFLIFSTTSSFNFSSLTQSSNQSVNAYATAGGTATMQFQVTGLQPFAKQLYDTNPDEFTQTCGDQVITKMPVKNQIVAGMNFYTNSNSFNQTENAKLSGSYLITSVSADVATQYATSSTSASTNINWITMGQYDTNLFNKSQTQIQACLAANGANQACTTAFLTMAQAATTAFTNNINVVNTTPDQPLWANYFVVDYSQTANFTFISDQTALIQAGVANPVDTNPDFKPYKAAIQLNVDVLQDLQIANLVFQNNIGPEFNQYLTTPSSNPYPYLIDATSLSAIYTYGLTSTVNAISGQIQSCLSSTNESSIATNCSALNPSQTVNNAITSYFNAPFSAAINSRLAASIAASVDGLIYDSVTNGFSAPISPGTQNPVMGLTGFIGYTIWVPDAYIGNDVITLPNIKSSNITATNLAPEPFMPTIVYNNVFAVFDDYLYAESAGIYYQSDSMMPDAVLYTGIPNQQNTSTGSGVAAISSSTIPSYSGQTCTPFSAGSAGCTYTYGLLMVDYQNGMYSMVDNMNNSKSRLGTFHYNDVIVMTDNYQIGQGSLFKTLYPWAPDNN